MPSGKKTINRGKKTMKMTKILTITVLGTLLTACGPQMQKEGAAPAVVSTGSEHIHNVEGFGDFKHSHKGNSTAGHGHSWQQIQNEIKKQKGM